MNRDLSALQARTEAFVREHRLNEDIPSRVLDLASEVGEVAKEVLKGTDYGKRPFTVTPNFAEELGDAFFEILCIANAAGIDLMNAIELTRIKMQRRIERNGHPGSDY